MCYYYKRTGPTIFRMKQTEYIDFDHSQRWYFNSRIIKSTPVILFYSPSRCKTNSVFCEGQLSKAGIYSLFFPPDDSQMTSNYFTYFQLASQSPPRWAAHSAFGGGGRLIPANHQTPSQVAHSLPSPPEWRENRWKVRRLVDGDKDSLTGKAKSLCGAKQKQELIHDFPSAGRCVQPPPGKGWVRAE